MFNKVMRQIKQTQKDVGDVQDGNTKGALERRVRPAATKNPPGGSAGRKLIGKLFR